MTGPHEPADKWSRDVAIAQAKTPSINHNNLVLRQQVTTICTKFEAAILALTRTCLQNPWLCRLLYVRSWVVSS